ncbi:hypothetical protein TRAPUB_3447 [Trametes pubescens]|uniref:Uncharacterized protein n=1 Tax=Trametes pubescens TaxID=154538 RepID=A0A1M2VDN7_TRAPU|nr:hypothetical protein TRAPUB_3447 [Trametes pubescens]
MSTIPALAQPPASASQAYTPVPSSTSSTPTLRTRGIRVVIPSTQATARAATAATTPIHGHTSNSAASSPHALFGILETPTHGHGDFVIPSPSSHYRDSPTTPTQPRMSARTRRRSSLFSYSSVDDEDADASAWVAGVGTRGLTLSPMAEEGDEHELHDHEDEHKHENGRDGDVESSGAGYSTDEAHTDAPLLNAA